MSEIGRAVHAAVGPHVPATTPLVMSVSELAAVVQGDVDGDGSVTISGVAAVQEAEQGDVVFAESPRFMAAAGRSRASAVIASLDADLPDKPLIRVQNPRFAFAQVLDLFSPRLAPPAGVHPSAVVGSGCIVAHSASVGPVVSIGDRVSIGERTVILAGAVIGDDVQIGDDCVIYPCAVLYPRTVLGARVTIHGGAVIGSDGFGFVRIGQRLHKVPHVGNVIIHDDVEIGSNTTVDRGKTGSTVIGERTKIDNLVQIAHNVKIGSDTVIASMTGVAGSAVIGNGVTIAGQAGLKDHIRVGDGSVLLGQTGAWGDVPPGSILSGCPGTPHRERLRQELAIARGPETIRQVRRLETANLELTARVAQLEARLAHLSGPERNADNGEPSSSGGEASAGGESE